MYESYMNILKNEDFINLKKCSCDSDSVLNISSMSSMGGDERRIAQQPVAVSNLNH